MSSKQKLFVGGSGTGAKMVEVLSSMLMAVKTQVRDAFPRLEVMSSLKIYKRLKKV
jgi:hypothetical protein